MRVLFPGGGSAPLQTPQITRFPKIAFSPRFLPKHFNASRRIFSLCP